MEFESFVNHVEGVIDQVSGKLVVSKWKRAAAKRALTSGTSETVEVLS